MFLHMRRIIGRGRYHSRSRKNIVEWLQYAMSAAHFNGLHCPHTSFQPARTDDGKGGLSDRRLEHCDPCGKVIRFYQSLDGYNIANRVFQQEVGGSRWLYRDWSSKRIRGTKRALPDDVFSEMPHWNKKRKAGSWDKNLDEPLVNSGFNLSPTHIRWRDKKRALPDDFCTELHHWSKRRKLGNWYANRLSEFKLNEMICEMGHLSLSSGRLEPRRDTKR